MVDEVALEQVFLWVLLFPLLIIIPQLLRTHISPPHEVCDSLDQAAHYHTRGPKLGAPSLTCGYSVHVRCVVQLIALLQNRQPHAEVGCRVQAVDLSIYRMAWLGLIDPSCIVLINIPVLQTRYRPVALKPVSVYCFRLLYGITVLSVKRNLYSSTFWHLKHPAMLRC
jgi:hypothetical protein